jgi:hypothetical protein
MRNFVQSLADTDNGKETVPDLLDLLDHEPLLLMELTAVLDCGSKLYSATYFLEGDGFLSIKAYDAVQDVRNFLNDFRNPDATKYPLLNEAAGRSAAGNPARRAQLLDHGFRCVQPCIDYFNEHFFPAPGAAAKKFLDLTRPLAVFKALRLFDPVRVSALVNPLDDAKTVPFLAPDIPAMTAEMPLYLQKVVGIDHAVDVCEFWAANAQELPYLSRCAFLSGLLQPSSAAAERVFSLLENLYNDQQTACLADHYEAALMTRYNSLQRSHCE